MAQTVLLTGTSSGLGEAAAHRFLSEGWNVIATARAPEGVVRAASDERLLRARLDLLDPSSIDAAFDAAEARFGPVDVVVNNAGVGLGGPLEGVELEELREHFEVNVFGVAAVCRVAIARMRARGRGLLINVTSVAGRVGLPFLSPYCAGKFAVEGLTEALYYELHPLGIRVKLVEPGGMRTRFAHPWATHASYEPASRSVHDTMKRGVERSPSPEVAAKAVVNAARDPSDRLRYTTSDGAALLALRGLLPEGLRRAFLGKVLGVTQARPPRITGGSTS